MSGYEAWRRMLPFLSAATLTQSIEEDGNGVQVTSPAVDANQIEAIAIIYRALMKIDEKDRRKR